MMHRVTFTSGAAAEAIDQRGRCQFGKRSSETRTLAPSAIVKIARREERPCARRRSAQSRAGQRAANDIDVRCVWLVAFRC